MKQKKKTVMFVQFEQEIVWILRTAKYFDGKREKEPFD